MLRTTILSLAVLGAGFTLAAVAGSPGTDVAEAATVKSERDLADTVAELERRVATLERRLRGRKSPPAPAPGFIPLGEVVVNLRAETLSRYLRVSIVIAVEDGSAEAAADAIARTKPRIKDWLYSFLADLTIADINGRQNQDKLRADILAGVNARLTAEGHPAFVRAVLFDEINVQ